jgi:hypothetical protein
VPTSREQTSSYDTEMNGICKNFGELVECSAPNSVHNLHSPNWLEPDSDSNTSGFRCPEYTCI